MSGMRTGWVIKGGYGYVDEWLEYTECIHHAKVFGLKREAEPFCDDGVRVVKVEWQPQVVREVR